MWSCTTLLLRVAQTGWCRQLPVVGCVLRTPACCAAQHTAACGAQVVMMKVHGVETPCCSLAGLLQLLLWVWRSLSWRSGGGCLAAEASGRRWQRVAGCRVGS